MIALALEERADGLGCGGAEEFERRRLMGDEEELGPPGPPLGEVTRRQEGDLVERQGPRRASRDDEGQPGRLPAQVGQQLTESGQVWLTPEGERALERRLSGRADGDDQRVVVELLPLSVVTRLPAASTAASPPRAVPGAAFLDHLGQLEPPDRTEAERLTHIERPVVERGFRGQDLHMNEVAGQMPEGEHRLEGGYAASGDEDSRMMRPRRGHVAAWRVGSAGDAYKSWGGPKNSKWIRSSGTSRARRPRFSARMKPFGPQK